MLRKLAKLVTKIPLFVLLFWIVVTICVLPFSKNIANHLVGELTPPEESEALLVQELILAEFPEADSQQLIVTIEAKSAGDKLNKYSDELSRMTESILLLDEVDGIITSQTPGFERLMDEENLAMIVILTSESLAEAQKAVHLLRSNLAEENEYFNIQVTGLPAVAIDLSDVSEEDVARAEKTALPITLILLIIAFGAIIAALIPPLIGWTAVVLALGTLVGLSNVYPIHSLAQTVIVMLGLAAGIDYSLLMVTRFREEMLNGLDVKEATERSMVTAGKTIILSGGMVIVSLTALLFPELNLVRSIGIAGMIVILFTIIASLTIVPAVLVLLGNRLNWPAFIYKFFAPKFEGNIWGRLAKRVIAKPKRWAITSVLFLLLASFPVFWLNIYNQGVYNLSSNVESRQGVDVLEELQLEGFLDRIDLVIDLGEDENFYGSNYIEAAFQLTKDLQDDLGEGVVMSPTPLFAPLEEMQLVYAAKNSTAAQQLGDLASYISESGRYIMFQIIPETNLDFERRDEFITEIYDSAQTYFTDVDVLLGGDPVAFEDFEKALYSDFPIAIILVLVLSFIFLLLLFRSLYTAFVAVLGNVLVLGASFGILVLVFKWGFNVQALHPMVPVIVFAISFGLSMDYQVFLLSRIREFQQENLPLEQAIEKGVSYTARTITFAALIMGVIFVSFMISDVETVKMLGFGLAVAVVIDATIARLILMPALLMVGGRFMKNKKQ